MPNWCLNYVSFTNDENTKAFLSDIEVFALANQPIFKVINIGNLLKAKGVPEELYDRIYERYLVLPVEIHYSGDSSDCTMQFETAWDYPATPMSLLVGAYGLSGTALAEEAGNGVYYKYVYENGDEIESTNYLPIIERRARKYVLRYLKDMRKGTAKLGNRKHASIISAIMARLIKKYRKNPETMSHWDIEEGVILGYLLSTRKITTLPSAIMESIGELESLVTAGHRFDSIIPNFVDWETFT